MRRFEYPFEGCRWTRNAIIAREHRNNWATAGEASVSAETQRLIEALTLLPFVYIPIHHGEKNWTAYVLQHVWLLMF